MCAKEHPASARGGTGLAGLCRGHAGRTRAAPMIAGGVISPIASTWPDGSKDGSKECPPIAGGVISLLAGAWLERIRRLPSGREP